jgi:S1-C subfamily serine protease
MTEIVLVLSLFSRPPFFSSLFVNLAMMQPSLETRQFSPLLTPKSAPKQDVKSLEAVSYAITVKVKAGRGRGSGILIRRQGTLYTVLTNRHVVVSGTPYVIQTPDQRSHPASLLKKIDFRGNDLALLQFRSGNSYAIATLGRSETLSLNAPVLAAGYPLDAASTQKVFSRSTGTISLIPKQPFVGGYQLGYTNPISQGMSGGPVLNTRGEVIGINSLHAHPLWGDPYEFVDGSKPLPQERSLITRSSWAVPIDTFLCLAPAIAKTSILACRAGK